jgi:hypothetical protein
MTLEEEIHAVLLLEEIATLLHRVADMIGRALPPTPMEKES